MVVYIANPPNAFCVTALPCKILIAILVLFSQIQTSLFHSGSIVVIFPKFHNICKNHARRLLLTPSHVLSQLTLGMTLKLGLMRWYKMAH